MEQTIIPMNLGSASLMQISFPTALEGLVLMNSAYTPDRLDKHRRTYYITTANILILNKAVFYLH